MELRLSEKAARIAPSMTLAIDAKAKRMKAEGIDVVGFGAGEPDFAVAEHVMEAAHEALRRGLTRYTPVAGMLELREAICRKLLRENGLSYEPQDIVVSGGAKHSLFNSFQAILNPGDEVLIMAPYWVSYPEMVRMADGVPVFVETKRAEGYQPNPAAVEAAITPRTRAIIVNSPSNPTGAIYPRATLAALADIALRHELYVVSDEIYERLCYDGKEALSIASLGAELKRQTIVVNGLSKSAAMTGWRIGYTACARPIATAMANYQSHATSNANAVAQFASIAALDGPQERLHEMVAAFEARRNAMVSFIQATPGLDCLTPSGAFYVMMKVSDCFGKRWRGRTIHNSLEFAELLLEGVHVAVVPGITFGAEGYVRLSYAVSMPQIEKGLRRIAEFVAALA